RDLAAELGVEIVLVGQAAEEPAAAARHLARVQREVLILRHFDRDRDEVPEEARAAELAAADADAADELRLVAGADLLQLDAGLESRRELLDEIAEVDPAGRREVDDDLVAAELDVALEDRHLELELVDAAPGDL